MAVVPLTIPTGATFVQSFLWQTPDPTTGVLTPQNFTGLTAKAQFRKKPGSPVLFEVSVGAGTLLLGNAGAFTLVIPGNLTAAIRDTEGVYDVLFTTVAEPNGEPSYRPVEGPVTYDLAVTSR